MGTPKIILLPGLDGNGFYFSALRDLLNNANTCLILSYPPVPMDHRTLCDWALSQLDADSDYIVAAESFGGPLGIMLAQALGKRAKGLVLSATFCKSPLPPLLLNFFAHLYPYILRIPAAAHLVNSFLCNGHNLSLAKKIHHLLMNTPDTIIIHRIRALTTLNVADIASQLAMPCLILKPTHERLIWYSNMDALIHKTVQHIKGPHMLMGTQPVTCAQAISNFIKKIN